jgi:hypothetical protein
MIWFHLFKMQSFGSSDDLCFIHSAEHSIRFNILVKRGDTKADHSLWNNVLFLELPQQMEILILLLSVWRQPKNTICTALDTFGIIGC